MIRTISLYIYAAVMAAGLLSCSEIAEEERFVELPLLQAPAGQRHVLLEDFTGQSCKNCPDAAEIIHEMQALYGSDVVIAVGVYSGPFGKPNGSAMSLVTELGTTLWNRWFTESTPQPIGMLNRRTSAAKEDWKRLVAEALSDSTRMTIEVEERLLSADSTRYTLSVRVADPDHTEGTLQVMLIENDIVASQMTTASSRPNKSYVHNHVLRASMNGDWGESLTLGTEGSTRTYTVEMDSTWVPANMEAVIFVTTDQGVEQVEVFPLLDAIH